ncbi:MAG: branched-chain amino acid ABC transporter permease, partial [Anaerolineales bacterium]
MIEAVMQNLVFGILLGALYGLAAVGIAMVFGVTKILNVAHGELMMLGGYATFWLFSLYDLDPFLSLVFSIIFLILVGFVLYRLLFARTIKLPEEEKIKNTMLIGFGLTLILQNIALLLWTADDRGITTAYSGAAFSILGVRFPYIRVAGLAIALICIIALQLFLRRTYSGKAIRATVEDWEAASLVGIDVRRVYMLSFLIGAALAGVAGTLVLMSYSVDPAMGMHWTLKSLIVMVLGGVGNFVGTFVAGILLGVTESATAFFISG